MVAHSEMSMATPMALPASIATPARDSMPFTSTKGLLNHPGQNNCFLNSAVQVLWHLDIFRRSFRDLSGHACMADSCIFCALKELFSQLQFSTETALPPDALRRALAESFFDQQRFQLGFMDDAAECFENMLLRIHTHIAHGEAEDMCNAKHCISHQKFAMTLVEQSICNSCGASSEPLSYTQMVHYVSTSTLVYQVRNRAPNSLDSFGQLLHKAGSMGDVRTCPSACGAVIQIGRTLMNHPEIVSVGLVWNSERPTLEHIMEVFSTIGTTLRLGDVFNTVVDARWAETSMHNLVGVVTYYGKHYSTFFFHTKLRIWIYFDDATVREVGPRWDQVVDKCRKGRYQPLLLLYALPDGTPVNTENAPKQITPFYTDKVKKNPQLRRSVTPSPEKPMIGNTRRAITPNPDNLNQKPPLPRPYNDYQNLSVIQKNIYGNKDVDTVDGCLARTEPEYISRKALDFHPKPQVNIHRTLSSGSSSGVEGMIPEHLNIPRRRDSGNWSGDRNSASSASSTTMENPYLYLVGKVPPGSPTRSKSDSSTGSGVYDAGYDSYSLSSNDSSTMSTLQHLMKMGHLAKIPEDYNNVPSQVSQSCDVLCDEADELLVKSRQLEDEHDLVLALALCNAAATKARAAMNAPYNNPQTLTLARMKHNTCIMRARSLHRRMTQTQIQKESPPEIRHTREGSSSSGKHSRQSSRDKGQHSRQNSRELLVVEKEKPSPAKNIEIYATLPKKKDGMKKINQVVEDEDYVLYDKPGRESRSIFSRKNKDKEAAKLKEKRSRSEDRNKMSRDFSLAPEAKDTLKKAKEEKEDKKEKDKGKKQHKIRRKLLMGGLIKRKNRSMPDLTDAAVEDVPKPLETVDDSTLGLKDKPSMCGYLSEGHLEFSGAGGNPNLERSKLMRKSFHGSAGKILTAAKVPPPPPLRTTSQLSKAKSGEEEQYYQYYQNPNLSYSFEEPSNTIVTRADVHHEQSPIKQEIDSGVDEIDCMPNLPNLELPPYPSPMGSVVHSRQASEEFPPPPPPLDLSALDEHLPKPPSPPPPNSLLAQLQSKRQEILSQDTVVEKQESKISGGDVWLKELQAKQAALRMKKQAADNGVDVVNTQRYPEAKCKSVKDLASKFEEIKAPKKKEEDANGVNPEQIAEEIREVEMLSAGVNKILGKNDIEEAKKNRLSKKKSVSFCDQVILVATAEEQEDDSYIPNPILERVLRTAMNKPETAAIRQEIIALRESEKKTEDLNVQNQRAPEQMYVRRNSMDNLLNGEEFRNPHPPQLVQNHHQQPYNGTYGYQGVPQQQQHQQHYGQYGGHTAYRQSPYQAVPQNSPAYNAYYAQRLPPQQQQSQYSSSPRNGYNHIRQGSPSPNYQSPPQAVYQHPPSPSPSSISNYNYQPNMYRGPLSPSNPNNNMNNPSYEGMPYSPYQRVPDPNAGYRPEFESNQGPYQRVPYYPERDVYQRVPPLHGDQEMATNGKYSPYQHALPPKQILKKTVSFEPGTKSGTESPLPKPVMTPIIVNNANNSVPTDKTKCNLCRKKNVVAMNLYCTDCEFYMSRFKPRS